MENQEVLTLHNPKLESLVLVTCSVNMSGHRYRYSYPSTMKKSIDDIEASMLAITDSIRSEAQRLIGFAELEVDAAASADAHIFASDQDIYESPIGQLANLEIKKAQLRVTDLRQLMYVDSAIEENDWVNVQKVRDLLKHFGRSLSIVAI